MNSTGRGLDCAAVEGFLQRNFFEAALPRLLAACIPLSILVFLLQNAAESILAWLATELSLPSRLVQVQASQAVTPWLSPLLLAPLIENLICLAWIRLLAGPLGNGRWIVPSVVAGIATAFHTIISREVVYLSIFINFFVFCALMHNTKNKVHGYLASVMVHALTNLLVLLQLRGIA